KRFSEMSKQELEQQLLHFKEAAMKQHQAGFYSEAAVYEQKFYFAKSYLLDPSQFEIHKQYQVIGEEESFLIHSIRGRMAWGNFAHSDEIVALPIAKLEIKKDENTTY